MRSFSRLQQYSWMGDSRDFKRGVGEVHFVYILKAETTEFDGELDMGCGLWPEQLEEWSCHLLK